MNRHRHEFLRRTALMALPLLLLAAVTVAWFINTPTAGFSEMSFAAIPSGAGAAISVGTADKALRTYTPAPNESVANTVTWGALLPMEQSTITVENMVPGQCAYYKFSCNRPAKISISNLVQLDKDGKPVTTGNVQLADYLSVYLYPLKETPGVVSSVDAFPLLDKTRVTSALPRETTDPNRGYLTGGVFKKGTWQSPLFTPAVGDTCKDYVMVVYCDTENHEKKSKPTDLYPPALSTLAGSVSFRMSFVVEA